MERRQWTKEGATLQELQEMAHVEVWGRKRTSFFWVSWHCRFICSNCVDFSWEGYFDALLQHLAFTEQCKCFHFSLVLLESVAIRFMTVSLE